MAYEPSEQEKKYMAEVIQKYVAIHERHLEKRRKRYAQRKELGASPPHTSYRFFLPETTAHHILTRLSEKGPTTRYELFRELRQSETSINSQILRLLDHGLVSRDLSTVYSITDNGEEALQQLDVGMSHTRWLR